MDLIPKLKQYQEKFFSACCYGGEIKLVKWIHKKLPTIDISNIRNLSFYFAISSESKEII